MQALTSAILLDPNRFPQLHPIYGEYPAIVLLNLDSTGKNVNEVYKRKIADIWVSEAIIHWFIVSRQEADKIILSLSL